MHKKDKDVSFPCYLFTKGLLNTMAVTKFAIMYENPIVNILLKLNCELCIWLKIVCIAFYIFLCKNKNENIFSYLRFNDGFDTNKDYHLYGQYNML